MDSNYTQRWKNNAGTVVAGIRGDGAPTATTDLVTKSYTDTLLLAKANDNEVVKLT